MAEGLQHLHKQRILHNDLAARNILLTGEGTAKIADFGLSEQLQDGQKSITVDDPKRLIPVRWSAPEIQGVRKEYSIKSDIFSLGCTYIEVLTGAPPFAALNNRAVQKEFLEKGDEELQFNSQTYEGNEKAYKDLISQMIRKKPQKRPSLDQVIEQLKSIESKIPEKAPEIKTETRVTILSDPADNPEYRGFQRSNDSGETDENPYEGSPSHIQGNLTNYSGVPKNNVIDGVSEESSKTENTYESSPEELKENLEPQD